MPHIWRIAAGLLLGAALACSSPLERTGPSAVLVELDAYSGLPNPRWTLSQAQARALEERLSGLPLAQGTALPEGGLGYRGFRVENRGEGGIPRQVYIAQGLVVFSPEQGARVLHQDVRGAEAWLQDQARQQGHGPLLP